MYIGTAWTDNQCRVNRAIEEYKKGNIKEYNKIRLSLEERSIII